MCGRFTIVISPAELLEFFNVINAAAVDPNYNVAPTCQVPAILESENGREMRQMRWGLIPSWADKKTTIFNVRSETVMQKFGNSFQNRRCIIPANGFYEWHVKTKQPHYFSANNGFFAFAGLWDTWEYPEGNTIETCTILTKAANNEIEPIHGRMPVILQDNLIDTWLTNSGDQNLLNTIVQPSNLSINYYPVSTRVNNWRNNDCSLMNSL